MSPLLKRHFDSDHRKVLFRLSYFYALNKIHSEETDFVRAKFILRIFKFSMRNEANYS